MNKSLNKWLNDTNELEEELPSFHNTRSYYFRDIYENSKIEPTRCPVFNEDLAYFFYGKPSYRAVSDQSKPDEAFYSSRHLPVCIAVESYKLEFKRVYPFDSGGFNKGFYSPHLSNDYGLGKFELDAVQESPRKLVKAVFGTNIEYIAGNPLEPKNLDYFEFELEDYLSLVSAKNQNGDDRKSSIEIQTNRSIELNENSVFAVVLPLAALQISEVRDVVLNKWKAIPITYDSYNGGSPKEYHGAIRQGILNALRSEGRI